MEEYNGELEEVEELLKLENNYIGTMKEMNIFI